MADILTKFIHYVNSTKSNTRPQVVGKNIGRVCVLVLAPMYPMFICSVVEISADTGTARFLMSLAECL